MVKLEPSKWDVGYATEALNAILGFGFGTLNLHRIECGCSIKNLASFRVMEKVGMTREGIKRQLLPLGDVWYKNIVGEYEYSWNDFNLQIYDSGSFEAKEWAYEKLKTEYGGIMAVPFLNNSYIVPYLTLYNGKTAKLSLEINIKNPPKKLEFKYDDTLFKLNHKDIAQKAKGKHTLPNYLEITCIKTFSNDKYIEVLADDLVVGKLRVHRNGKNDRKK